MIKSVQHSKFILPLFHTTLKRNTMEIKIGKKFKHREFEGQHSVLKTFLGHGGRFCIMLNAKCVHSVKTLRAHNLKVQTLVKEYRMDEIDSEVVAFGVDNTYPF